MTRLLQESIVVIVLLAVASAYSPARQEPTVKSAGRHYSGQVYDVDFLGQQTQIIMRDKAIKNSNLVFTTQSAAMQDLLQASLMLQGNVAVVYSEGTPLKLLSVF